MGPESIIYESFFEWNFGNKYPSPWYYNFLERLCYSIVFPHAGIVCCRLCSERKEIIRAQFLVLVHIVGQKVIIVYIKISKKMYVLLNYFIILTMLFGNTLFLFIHLLCLFPLKLSLICKENTFLGWAAEMSMWAVPMNTLTNLCQISCFKLLALQELTIRWLAWTRLQLSVVVSSKHPTFDWSGLSRSHRATSSWCSTAASPNWRYHLYYYFILYTPGDEAKSRQPKLELPCSLL